MQVVNKKELAEAIRRREQEIIITDPGLASSVKLLQSFRAAAVVLVVVILAVAVIIVINPLQWGPLNTPQATILKNVLIGVALILLFAEYLVPVVRLYRIASQDHAGLRLVLRRRP